jgi:hypothetical protein
MLTLLAAKGPPTALALTPRQLGSAEAFVGGEASSLVANALLSLRA